MATGTTQSTTAWPLSTISSKPTVAFSPSLATDSKGGTQMANNADGTDGKGAPRMGGGQVSGKNDGSFGHTSSRGIPAGGKTVSGKSDGSYGTKAARNGSSTRFPS